MAVGEDRRELTTALTARGREFLGRVAAQRRDNARIAASSLSTGERAMFIELVDKVVIALEADLDLDPTEPPRPA